MEEVAPSSVPMFVMVVRSGTVSVSTPGPVYSNTLPTPPFTESRRSISRMTSFAVAHPESSPSSRTFTTSGIST